MSDGLFSGKCFESAGFLNLTPADAYSEAQNNKAIFVDVRELNLIGYKRFNVPFVLQIPYSILKHNLEELPRDKPLILADSVGLRSHEAMIFLLSKGFKNIANLAGGIVEWERDGMPLIINEKERLDGSCMCQLRPRNK